MQSVFIEPLFLNLLSKKFFIIYTSYLTTTDEKSVKRMCQNNHFQQIKFHRGKSFINLFYTSTELKKKLKFSIVISSILHLLNRMFSPSQKTPKCSQIASPIIHRKVPIIGLNYKGSRLYAILSTLRFSIFSA